jgi:hypothetical protein
MTTKAALIKAREAFEKGWEILDEFYFTDPEKASDLEFAQNELHRKTIRDLLDKAIGGEEITTKETTC